MTDVITPPLIGSGIRGPEVIVADPHHDHHEEHGPTGVLKWLTSTDHKIIGMNYMITSLVMFFIAGGMALVIRIQLVIATELVSCRQTYNELFTMHGSLMLYLFAGPFAFGGLANFIVPLQIGAPTWRSRG
jgi:cytochrome c oxidase subunit 1